MVRFGMKNCECDHSVFSYTSERRKILLIIYVSHKKRIIEQKVFHQASFQTKDLGKLRYSLDIEVAHSKG